MKATEPTLTYSRTPPGDNPLADAVNLSVATRMGQQRMAETILGRAHPDIPPALAGFTDVVLSAADEFLPGFAVRLLNHFTANL